MPDQIKVLTATFSSFVNQAIDNRQKELHTAMPGIIVSFDAASQLAQVQPAIKRMFNTGDQEKEILVATNLPVLINVPVSFPQGGGFSLTFPVEAGDECLLTFCERSIDNWHEFGDVQEPQAWRLHSFSDATCFVGINSKQNKIQNFDAVNVQLRDDDGATNITIKPGQKIDFNVPVLLTVNAPETDWNGDINLTGDIMQTGDTTSTGTVTGQTDVKFGPSNLSGITHKHTGVTSGSETSGGPVA